MYNIVPETDQGHLKGAAVALYDYAVSLTLPSVIFRPKLFIDGNKWCALYGDNLMDGVCGFGDSPEQAMHDFNMAWTRKIKAGTDGIPKKSGRLFKI